MQKRSHKLLASSLLKSHKGFGKRRHELAFLFGSFQPDCNPFTFLRGSFRARAFCGHSFSNSHRYICRKIQTLQQCKCWKTRHYYTLGKLTHYLADAFTFPHNVHFPNSLMDHHRYETELRLSLQKHLSSRSLLFRSHCPDLMASIPRLHRQYALTESDIHGDIHYILQAACLLMTLCPTQVLHP